MFECSGWNPSWSAAESRLVMTGVNMRASITLAAGQRSEICRYEVPRKEYLPYFGIWMTIDELVPDDTSYK